jgi:hypothetical protein
MSISEFDGVLGDFCLLQLLSIFVLNAFAGNLSHKAQSKIPRQLEQ